MSLEARGTLNDALTYAVLGRTCYAKSYFKPANPKSNDQVGIRCMVKFLTQDWQNLSATNQAKYQTLADKWNLSPYHAWLRHNMQRWTSHLLPISDLTIKRTPIFQSHSCHFHKFDRRHELTLNIIDCEYDPYSAEFCLSTNSGFTPARSNAKIIINDPIQPAYDSEFNATWIAPDDATYYLKARFAMPDGTTVPFV